MALTVLVTGAGGKTGSIVVRKLLEQPNAFQVKAMVRSEASANNLRKVLGALPVDIIHGDVMRPEDLRKACEGVQALVIVTSAMPVIDKLSLLGVICAKLCTCGIVKAKPSFSFKDGQTPEKVDFIGQCAQIDAAKAAGVKHIVLISSMAGTKPDHFLNVSLDKIVLWKRRAEKYLIASGTPYTIIHPGGLLPHPPKTTLVPGGKRELFVGVDDSLLGGKNSTIPREDLAQVTVDSLLVEAALGRSFDLGSGPEGEGTLYSGDLEGLLTKLGNQDCSYNAPKLPGE